MDQNVCPGFLLFSSNWISSILRAILGGHPSITQPIATPWDSPQVVKRNNLPNVLCDMVYFSLIAKLSTKLVRYTLYLLSSNLLILDFAFSLYLSRKSIDF